MIWRLLVILAALLVVASFALIFKPAAISPSLFALPYILWTGMLTTIVLVVLTYLGAKSFPYKEK